MEKVGIEAPIETSPAQIPETFSQFPTFFPQQIETLDIGAKKLKALVASIAKIQARVSILLRVILGC
jgi:hypothetical protein